MLKRLPHNGPVAAAARTYVCWQCSFAISSSSKRSLHHSRPLSYASPTGSAALPAPVAPVLPADQFFVSTPNGTSEPAASQPSKAEKKKAKREASQKDAIANTVSETSASGVSNAEKGSAKIHSLAKSSENGSDEQAAALESSQQAPQGVQQLSGRQKRRARKRLLLARKELGPTTNEVQDDSQTAKDLKQESKKTSKQDSKQASEQGSKEGSKQPSKQDSKHTSKQDSEQASKQDSKQGSMQDASSTAGAPKLSTRATSKGANDDPEALVSSESKSKTKKRITMSQRLNPKVRKVVSQRKATRTRKVKPSTNSLRPTSPQIAPVPEQTAPVSPASRTPKNEQISTGAVSDTLEKINVENENPWATKGWSLESFKLGEVASFQVKDVEFAAIEHETPPVPRLAHGLERALFNRGVLQFRDLHSRVYNFDPALEMIPPVDKIDFNTMTNFTPPSKDTTLSKIAEESRKKYIGSTSSMTGILKQFHTLLSGGRGLNFNMFPRSNETPATFTKITLAPESVFLRYKDGVYAVDADKEYDAPNVLSLMGRYLEKYFTADKDTFEKYRAGAAEAGTPQDEPGEAYHYSTVGDFLLRSQLDAQDKRLPGAGVFDLKTRAVLPIRMQSSDFEHGMDYEINAMHGHYSSFEREMIDMCRSTMMKYLMQVRIGRMDGIFVAYHNIARIFGFQYLSINEMDYILHGQEDRTLGDREFLASMRLLNDLFKRATEEFPRQSLRLLVLAPKTAKQEPTLHFFAEPVTEEEIEQIQTSGKETIAKWERELAGLDNSTASEDGSIFDNIHEDVSKFRERIKAMKTEKDRAKAEVLNAEALRKALVDIEDTTATEEQVSGEALSQKLFTPHMAGTRGHAEFQGQSDPPEEPKPQANKDSELEWGPPPKPPAPPGDRRPLLGLTLMAKNKINGLYQMTPIRVAKSTRWEVEYRIGRLGDNQAHDLYNTIRTRRRKLMWEKLEALRAGGAVDGFFMSLIRDASVRGREWRAKRDAMDKIQEAKDGGVWVWDREEPVERKDYVKSKADGEKRSTEDKREQL